MFEPAGRQHDVGGGDGTSVNQLDPGDRALFQNQVLAADAERELDPAIEATLEQPPDERMA